MAPPLNKHQLFHSQDLDFVRAEVAKVYCDHSLNVKKGCALNARHHHAKLPHMSLNYMSYGTEVQITPGELDKFFLIQLPLKGSAPIQSGKEEVISRPGLASIPSPDQFLRMRWSEDCEQLLVQIRRDALEQRLSSLISRPLNKPLSFDLLMNCDDSKVAAWWRTINFLLNELDNEQPAIAGDGVNHFEQLVMSNLLYSQHHNYTEALNAKSESIAPVHVKKAEEYIRENIASHITLDDLVAVTLVSSRSLHEGFRRFRGTSPLNYLRSLRLESVRNDLLTADDNVRVTDIATKWGFTQLGRFSVTYKKVFGESPSETIRRTKH